MATDSANGIGVDIDAMFLMGTAVQLFSLLLLLPAALSPHGSTLYKESNVKSSECSGSSGSNE